MVDMELKKAGILIVEDDKSVSQFLQRALKRFGYNNLQAVDNAEDALQIIGSGKIALALVDLRMPGKGGLWLLKRLSQMPVDTSVVVVSASHEFEDAIAALNRGAERYIEKPVRTDELKHTVENVLEKRKLVIENRIIKKKLETAVKWPEDDETA